MKVASWILGMAALVVAYAAVTTAPKVFGVVPEAPASPSQVTIDSFIFTPSSITVATGTSVKWVNHDEIPHNVVSNDKSFKSKVLDTNEEFVYTFSKPGIYTYVCSIHPKMTGKVVVK